MLSLHTTAITALPVLALPVTGFLIKIWDDTVCSLKKYTQTHRKPQQTRTPLTHICYKLENTRYQINLDRGSRSALKHNWSQRQKAALGERIYLS